MSFAAPVVSRVTVKPAVVRVIGTPGHVSGSSSLHVGEQPSAGSVLPSSQSSPASLVPLPHAGPPLLDEELVLDEATLLLDDVAPPEPEEVELDVMPPAPLPDD